MINEVKSILQYNKVKYVLLFTLQLLIQALFIYQVTQFEMSTKMTSIMQSISIYLLVVFVYTIISRVLLNVREASHFDFDIALRYLHLVHALAMPLFWIITFLKYDRESMSLIFIMIIIFIMYIIYQFITLLRAGKIRQYLMWDVLIYLVLFGISVLSIPFAFYLIFN